MADADGLFTPPPFKLPDDRNEDAFVPVGNLIEELIRRYPSKTGKQLGDEFVVILARGWLDLKDENGKRVDPEAIGYMDQFGLNPDNVTLIVNPELQRMPVRLVSWRDFNKLFPGETKPAPRIPDRVSPVVLDYFAHVCAAQDEERPWSTDRADEIWEKHRIDRESRLALRNLLRHGKLKAGKRR